MAVFFYASSDSNTKLSVMSAQLATQCNGQIAFVISVMNSEDLNKACGSTEKTYISLFKCSKVDNILKC